MAQHPDPAPEACQPEHTAADSTKPLVSSNGKFMKNFF